MAFGDISQTYKIQGREVLFFEKKYASQRTIMKLVLFWMLGFPLIVFAAVPASINYQGYLTDSSGIPINASVNVTFRIYDIDTGGTALWNEIDSVTVNDGKFSTQLGDGIAFPVNLFDGNPLYLSIEISTDGEMSPRKPLDTTPYSFKAGDADTLNGLDANQFVGITGDQTITGSLTVTADLFVDGGIDAQGLGAIAGITDMEFELNSGGGITFEDGTSQDTDAVSAILAADGTGSTLDADLVDGMQASEIIDAASDEVRTPISSLPFGINVPGSYYLTDNLTLSSTSSNGISITVDNVTIDLMGFTLTGSGKTSGGFSGISATGRSYLTIKNGTIQEFGRDGISAGGSPQFGYKILNMRLLNNGDDGMYVIGGQHLIRDVIAKGNGEDGIDTGGGGGGFFSVGTQIINNIAENNDGHGIAGGHRSYLEKNTSSNNGGNGINSYSSMTIKENTVHSNLGWGIYADSGSSIKNNTVYSNNTDGTATEGGIRASSTSRITANFLRSNQQQGIDVEGFDTVVNQNEISGSTIGINFAFSGSAYRDNTISGFSTDIMGTASDGGGNFTF